MDALIQRTAAAIRLRHPKEVLSAIQATGTRAFIQQPQCYPIEVLNLRV